MIEITWLGHSGFALQAPDGETLLLDPWLDNPKFPKGYQLERADAILISHAHGDHSGSVVELAERFSPTVVGIYEIAQYFGAKGVKNVIGMNKGGSTKIGPFRV